MRGVIILYSNGSKHAWFYNTIILIISYETITLCDKYACGLWRYMYCT